MNLISRGVLSPETELTIRDEIFILDDKFNLFSRSFSNNFDIICSRDIGLHDVDSWGGLPGFGLMMTSATFHS
jgi:hypothetical protein